MKLIVPMSGLGSRFVNAGYSTLKPLIKVHGRPIIEWVLKMFPNMDDVIFICRRGHIKETNIKNILLNLRPKAEIVEIEGAKLGPVGALVQAADYIPDSQSVLVTYCDYYMHWDCASFISLIDKLHPAGVVPCYTGFHPHLLPKKNLYACCRVDASNNLLEIKEKHTFNEDKSKALHSPGLYYFASGGLLKKYMDRLISQKKCINGEYYVSMLYGEMLADNLSVLAPDCVKYFCQWGTPEDLTEYLYWTNYIENQEKVV